MKIVIGEIVDDLQKELIQYMDMVDLINPEEALNHVIELVLRFAMENKGLIHYLFVSSENDGNISYYGIVQNFLFSNAFASTVLSKLDLVANTDPQVLYSRFLILFSSLAMPMIMEFASNKENYRQFSIDNPAFKQAYIHELLKILKE